MTVKRRAYIPVATVITVIDLFKVRFPGIQYYMQ